MQRGAEDVSMEEIAPNECLTKQANPVRGKG